MIHKESSIESPVHWFESFLYHEGINDELIRFIDNAEIINAKYDAKQNSLTFYEQNNDGEWEKIITYFPEHLSQLLATQRKISKILIDNFIEQTTDVFVQKNYLLKTLDKLDALMKIINKFDYSSIIYPKLFSIIEHIKIRYYTHKLGHPAFNRLEQGHFLEHQVSLFGSDRLGRFLLKDLFLIFYSHDIIDEEVSEAEFIDVFSSEAPSQLGIKIKFNIKNTEIAYIFREAEPLFTSLKFETVGESKCFYTKQGNLISRGYLDPAMTRLRKKSSLNNLYLVSQNVKIAVLEIRELISRLNTLNSIS